MASLDKKDAVTAAELTERQGRPVTTKGQYSQVWLEKALSVSCLSYGTVLVANFEFAGFAPRQKYKGCVFIETVRTAKS